MGKLNKKNFWECIKKIQQNQEAVIVFYQKGVEVGCIDGSEYIDNHDYKIESMGDGIFRIDCDIMSLFADSYRVYEP